MIHLVRTDRHLARLAAFFLLILLLAACQTAPTTPVPDRPEPATGTGEIPADTGGVVEHPMGGRVIVPAGALSADAVITIRDAGYTAPRAEEPLLRLSRRFVVDVDGAEVIAPLRFEWFDVPGGSHEDLLIGGNTVFFTYDARGNLLVRRTEPGGGGTVSASLGRELNLRDPGPRTVELVHIPGFDLQAPPNILNVHYYWQDDLPWCVPTSLSMVMNQYDGLEGIVANFELAGADHQADDEGNSYVGILGSLGVDEDLYRYLKWDADLIPSAPFTDYVKRVVNGYNLQDLYGPVMVFPWGVVPVPNVFIPPRAPALSSTTTSHAFVGVGANNSHIWLHDPSGAFSGDASIAEQLTWNEFRQIAIDDASSTELRTLVFFATPKDNDVRHGSIVLEEGTNGSLAYRGSNGQIRSRWQWNGAHWENGYVWDDPNNDLPQDGNYGNKFPLADDPAVLDGYFSYKARVANVTGSSRTYQLWVFLGNTFNPSLDVAIHDITVPAYSWKSATVQGVLDDFVINSEGDYKITFELYEGGELQDVKRIGFRVGDGPLAIP